MISPLNASPFTRSPTLKRAILTPISLSNCACPGVDALPFSHTVGGAASVGLARIVLCMVSICVIGTLCYAEMVREGHNAAAKYILNVRGAIFPERVKVGLRDIGEPSDDFVGRRVNEKKLDLALYLPWKLVQAHEMLLRPSCSKRLRCDRPATKKHAC